jgi:L-alanine-DL-glutamate epimerase-like enolase superfamily enzyme
MNVARIETLFCDAGWRPWIFVKATADDGLVGWAEVTDAYGSPHGVRGVIEDLAPLVVGRDPRAFERTFWDLYRHTRQSPGGVVAKAIAGIENALLDLKSKALGVPVYELFGGPVRETVAVYWSHCGTGRAWAAEGLGIPKLASYDDVRALGREVVERGFGAFKTNIVVPGDKPRVLMPGFGDRGEGADQPAAALTDQLERLLSAFAEGTQGGAQPIVDLNFNLTPANALQAARVLDAYGLYWLEIDCFDPRALADVRRRAPVPICSGENLYGSRSYHPFFEQRALDIASVDVIWNGFGQARKIAQLAELYEIACTPHNFYSHLATFISAHWCAATPNVDLFELDVDDVPWKDALTTRIPEIRDGVLAIPDGAGWSAEINEEVLLEHPWHGDSSARGEHSGPDGAAATAALTANPRISNGA